MSKGNKCPIDSSSSNDRDFANTHYQYRAHHHHPATSAKAENPLSHICRYLDVSDHQKSSKDNVELALEVEINESLKHVLTNSERNSSELLDVTIIRPSDSDTTHETTVALYKDEVRDFISLVEQHHKHQAKARHEEDVSEVSNYRKEKALKHRLQKAQKNDNKTKKEGNYSEESQETQNEKNVKIDENPKHVYATINTFDKIRQALPCQNKNRESEKSGTPCMCQHCGIVGVLVQSQKGPVAPFPPVDGNAPQQPQRNIASESRDTSPSRKEARPRKLIDLRKKKSLDQLQLLREINTRIKSLEKRVAIQEETAVPKEYLKHILHKVIMQYNTKPPGVNAPETKLKNNATQYSAKNIVEVKPNSHQRSTSPDRNKDTKSKCYQVHTVFEDHPNWLDYSKHKDAESKSPNDKKDGPRQKDPYWFWGEEVVKPGCDLKNKILKLLEDKLHRNVNEAKQTDPNSPRGENTRQFLRSDKPNNGQANEGIKVERDEKTIFLNNVHLQSTRNFNYLAQGAQLPLNSDTPKEKESICGKPVREPPLPNNTNKFSTFRNIFPKPNYPFDVKKTLDDSTFKKNIEAQKEKIKEKGQVALEEKYYNTYACHSMTTESQASLDYILQKLRNNAKIMESGLSREKEAELEAKFKLPNAKDVPGSLIKENLNRGGFRLKRDNSATGGSVDIKFVNPRIKQWSEESSTSDDKMLRQKARNAPEKKEPALEKKESLIYKLDFLKNLAKNKSTDQSRVLNKIWTQAKNTAKSKKDAVYIKIPFKNMNACEAQDNLIEMHLTLEELETVVKSAKMSSSGNVKVQSYKSSSDIDLGQRQHEEMKHANREILKRRQYSAKANKHREKR